MLFFVRKIVCMCMVAYNFDVSRSQSKNVGMFSPSLVEHPLFRFAINPMGYCSFLKNVFRTAAAAKLRQSCPTLCDPIDVSP